MWTVFFNVLTVLSFLSCILATFFAARSVRVAAELQQHCQALKPYSKQSLETRLDELEETIETVANRVKMTKVRNAANHSKGSSGEPDPRLDPEAWRAWQNRQLKTGVVN